MVFGENVNFRVSEQRFAVRKSHGRESPDPQRVGQQSHVLSRLATLQRICSKESEGARCTTTEGHPGAQGLPLLDLLALVQEDLV